MSCVKQSNEVSSTHAKPDNSVWHAVEMSFDGLRQSSVGDSATLLLTSTTIGSCAVKNVRTASS